MMRRKNVLVRAAIFGTALVLVVYSLAPVLWMVITSFKREDAIFAFPPQWIPKKPTLQNYAAVINNPKMIRYFLNTVIVSFGSTFLAVIISVLGAYGFSRYAFKGRKVVMGLVLFSRILPRVSLILPFFIILRNIGLLNTHLGLIIVYLIIGMPITIWLTKGFFDKIPIEIEESAMLDGCNSLTILFRLVVPIAAPAIGAVAMYAFILAWNELLLALTLTMDAATQTISIGLSYYKLEFGISWGNLMAGSVLMSIPAVLVFMVFQKSLIAGMVTGSVKE